MGLAARATDCPTKDSRSRWLRSHPVLIPIVASAAVGAVAPFLSVTMFVALMLVDVTSSVARLMIVDEVLLDRRCLLASRWRFLVN